MTLATIAYVVLAALGFGFVIFIHELGHFLFAKWAGVQVEVFSIGFGPKLLRRTVGETEYALSLLPFGGYVKMLGQDDNPAAAQPGPEEPLDPRSFLAASPKWRALILLGGVLFNLLSSYAILLGLAFSGMPIIRPLVGTPAQTLTDRSGKQVSSPADRLGLKRGDRILAVDGEPIRSFDDINTEVVINARDPIDLVLRRRGESEERHLGKDLGVKPMYSSDRGFAVLGLEPPQGDHLRLIAGTRSGPSGLELGERVVGVDGKDLPADEPDRLTGQEIHDLLLPWLGREVSLTLEKDQRRREARIRYAGDAFSPSFIGFPVVIDEVTAQSPAEKAGIQGGDILLAVDGAPAFERERCFVLLRDALTDGRACRLSLWRPAAAASAQRIECQIAGAPASGGRHLIGVKLMTLVTGRMPPLAVLEDGSASPLSLAGIAEGDTIAAIIAPDAAKVGKGTARAGAEGTAAAAESGVTLAVLSGGERVLVPLPRAAQDLAEKIDRVPTWARWLGAKPKRSLFEQLLGTRVEGGALAAGFARLSPADGSPTRDVDLRAFDAAAPGFLAALMPGDWIVGRTPTPQGEAIELVRGASGAPRLLPYDPGVAFAFDLEMVPYQLASWGEAFAMVNATSYNMVVKSLQLIPRFFRSADQGGIDPNKSLSGPVGMFRALKVRAEQFGIASYLQFLALIGLNLFLVNLLPIPITDGGQLLMLGIETAIGRPLPLRLRNLLQWAGFILVLALMLYVLGLDLSRL